MPIYGTEGDDIITGTLLNDVIYAYGGDDVIECWYEDDVVYAGTGDDWVNGDLGDDYLSGDLGNDTLFGDDGSDQIFGGDGKDYLDGGLEDDTIYGGAGNDEIIGGIGGNDYLDGGSGDDTFYVRGASGFDTYVGGEGTDYIYIEDPEEAGYYNYYTVGITSISGIEAIINDSVKDAYIAVDGAVDFSNTLIVDIAAINGSSGDDVIIASQFYDLDTSSVSGAIVNSGAGNDSIYGTIQYSDTLNGGDGDDWIYGRGGNDIINGGAGDDVLVAGAGGSTLAGGDGADLFWFETGEGLHTITDYTDGTDQFVVGSSISDIDVYAYNDGADALLAFDSGATYALLVGVSASDIDASDFLFA